MAKLSERPFHAFLSYSHADREAALKLHHWLTRIAGYQIWFDENHLQAGSSVATMLSEHMSACRNWIVLASKSAIASTYVAAERDQALQCAILNRDFNLIILRVDDCPLGQAWPSVSRFNWLDLTEGDFNPSIARELMDRLDSRTRSERQIGLRDIYVSRGWRPADEDFADRACEGVCACGLRLRLVGDAPDQTSFSIDRIREILSSCFGHIAVLPGRGSGTAPTESDYKYFTREIAISNELGIPVLVLAEDGTPLPRSLDIASVRVPTAQRYREYWPAEPPDWLTDFAESLKAPLDPQHMFLAAEYRESKEWVAQLRDFMEGATGIRCEIGRDYEGTGLREKIVSGIASASVVVANLERSEDSAPDSVSVNFNTCIEAGIAIGASKARTLAGKKEMSIFLTAPGREEDKGNTKQLPFMFKDDQITWYSSKAELLGHCRRLLLPFRRRVMNYDSTKSN